MKIWSAVGIVALIILSIFGIGVLFVVWYFASNAVADFADKVVNYWHDWKARKIQNDSNALRAKVYTIKPDEHGYNGIVTADGVKFLNLDSGETIESQIDNVIRPYIDDLRIRLYEQRKLLTAMAGSPVDYQQLQPVIEQTKTIAKLPQQVKLFDIIEPSRVSLDNLTIGVTLDEYGNVVPVQKSIHDLMHLLAIGITGAGKSTWVLAFLAEIEMCQEDIEVCVIDVHGSAFNLLQKWSKLRYPIARTNEQAKAILMEVKKESERRMQLYESVPMADDMPSYNLHSTDEKLVPWLIAIDEGTIMLSDSDISSYVASSVQGTRQYGIYVFMTGQTAKSNVIDTPIRDNFPTRLAFNNEKTSWRVVLGETPDGQLEEIPGRGWARLKGQRTPVMIQAPYIQRQDFYRMIERDGPRYDMPALETVQDSFDDRVREVYEQVGTANISAICRKLGKHPTGNDFYLVKGSLEKLGIL